MIGYHYTLMKNLGSILSVGLLPQSLSDDDFIYLSGPFNGNFPTEGTHVFRELLAPEDAFLVLAWLALGRNDYNICLLEVKYDEKDTQQSLLDNDDTIIFRSIFSVGDNRKVLLRFDLILESVPPENIKVVKTWDLLNYAKEKP